MKQYNGTTSAMELIEMVYEKTLNIINVEYEIIALKETEFSELIDVLSRTRQDRIRFEIADALIGGADEVYVIESQELRGALFSSTSYEETLKEWFKLSYLKEQQHEK